MACQKWLSQLGNIKGLFEELGGEAKNFVPLDVKRKWADQMKKNNDIVRSKIKVEVYIRTVCLFTACALIITFIYQIVKLFNPVDLKTSKHPERGIRKQEGQSDVIILPGILGVIFLVKRKKHF